MISDALYCTLSPVGGAPLELDELLELDALLALDELLELEAPDELLELDELEPVGAPPSPLLLELELPPIPPDVVSRLLRSGSTPYAQATNNTGSATKITLPANDPGQFRSCM